MPSVLKGFLGCGIILGIFFRLSLGIFFPDLVLVWNLVVRDAALRCVARKEFYKRAEGAESAERWSEGR